jgi:hypothetical protein
MNVDKYALKTEGSRKIFQFVSEGPKGAVKKLIQFQNTDEPNLYNLAFGDKLSDTEIDDLAITNNGDSEKVLSTVITALYAFFDQYPSAFVYAKGSTKARTRLYRMGIVKFYDEVIRDFYLYGQIKNEFHVFEIGPDYNGFLVQRKFN